MPWQLETFSNIPTRIAFPGSRLFGNHAAGDRASGSKFPTALTFRQCRRGLSLGQILCSEIP
jgi:hypothetical protein